MHLTGSDIAAIVILYGIVITLIVLYARASKTSPRPAAQQRATPPAPPRPRRGVAIAAGIGIALTGVFIAAAVDPAAAELLARILD